MNGENTHHTGFSPVTPEPGSKGWARIITRGCGGHYYDTPYGTEYDCSHGYGWACESCPIGIESAEREHEKWENAHQGPPCPASLRGKDGMIWWPSVGAEF